MIRIRPSEQILHRLLSLFPRAMMLQRGDDRLHLLTTDLLGMIQIEQTEKGFEESNFATEASQVQALHELRGHTEGGSERQDGSEQTSQKRARSTAEVSRAAATQNGPPKS